MRAFPSRTFAPLSRAEDGFWKRAAVLESRLGLGLMRFVLRVGVRVRVRGSGSGLGSGKGKGKWKGYLAFPIETSADAGKAFRWSISGIPPASATQMVTAQPLAAATASAAAMAAAAPAGERA